MMAKAAGKAKSKSKPKREPQPKAVREPKAAGNESYWVPGISRASVEKCIKNSLCFGVHLDGRQVGFARLVTDFVRYAHLLDVFVLPEFRGRGIGKLLIENILTHPELRTIVRYTLGTQDAQSLYAQHGFTAPANPERQMELLRPQNPPAPANAQC
jgi:GNAT superfamily N-acetyltransferase